MTVLKDSLVTSLYDDGLSSKDRQLLLELACAELEARYLMVPRMLIFYLSVVTILGVGGLALTQGFAFVGSVFWLFLSLAILIRCCDCILVLNSSCSISTRFSI